MPELPEVETRNRAWRPSDWALILVLTGQLLFNLQLNPISQTSGPNDWLSNFGLGVMFAQPLLCAWWTTWSSRPLVWRLPMGLAASFLLTLFITAPDYNLMGMVILQGLFFVFLAPLALIRRRYAWRLTTEAMTAPSDDGSGSNQFNIRYLLIWTTILAALCALTRYVVGGSAAVSGADELWRLPVFLLIFAILLSPALVGGTWILAGWRPVGLVIPFGLLLVLAATAISAVLAVNLTGPSPGVGEIYSIFVWFSAGATVSTMLSASVLRLAGYRAVRPSALSTVAAEPASSDA